MFYDTHLTDFKKLERSVDTGVLKNQHALGRRQEVLVAARYNYGPLTKSEVILKLHDRGAQLARALKRLRYMRHSRNDWRTRARNYRREYEMYKNEGVLKGRGERYLTASGEVMLWQLYMSTSCGAEDLTSIVHMAVAGRGKHAQKVGRHAVTYALRKVQAAQYLRDASIIEEGTRCVLETPAHAVLRGEPAAGDGDIAVLPDFSDTEDYGDVTLLIK